MRPNHDMSDHRPHGENILEEKIGNRPDTMLLFIGSVNCIRHKPYLNIGTAMQQKKAAMLCPSMSDFSTGRYLQQLKDAMAELSGRRGIKRFVIACGCQWVILSTDEELLITEMKDEYDIEVEIFRDDHLEFGDHP